MTYHSVGKEEIERKLNTNFRHGLSGASVEEQRRRFGSNVISGRKRKSLFKRLIEALSEPTLIILEFAWVITVGVNVGKFIKSGDGDVLECIGILAAILISAFLTVFMEGRSEKAFELLGTVYDKISVKALRDGKTVILGREEVVVGDVLFLETGDKVIADGRLIEAREMTVDESMLTGESLPVKKDAEVVLGEDIPLAERKNSVFSGTFISGGTGKMVVTAVGDNAELGVIAADLKTANTVSAPLNEKLNRLGKTITIIGASAAALVFVLSVIRLWITGEVNFFTVQDVFVEAIVLIVAAVPEGLPTTAAISLTLNVLKLAKSNALIRKLVAAETVGCVSVICSDKTGTLTQNRMTVIKLLADKESEKIILQNAAVNSSAVIKTERNKQTFFGSATECALLSYALKRGVNYEKVRDNALIGQLIPFNSQNKYMLTEERGEGVTYIKGAPEVIAEKCALSAAEKVRAINGAKGYQAEAKRVIAFAHKTDGDFIFDGMAVIADPVRRDVKKSVENCFSAGIAVKMLTGDNAATAESIARELGLITSSDEVATAAEIDVLSEEKLIAALEKIKVIARSTPTTKLKVVEALKKAGEVVAVTGDGVNDAPAIKQADIGIAMGSGSEITKEASDIVLLDDSFSTIVKAISFGRNIYRNFQRFIMFQLSVNLTAMIVVIVSLILGLVNPFNAMQLLWIDIIMDGPPALTLGMESGGDYMSRKPVKRTDNIVTFNMLMRIIAHAAFMSTIVILEYLYDFLGAGVGGTQTAIFCLFVMFQLFNAFNCRKTGRESIFSGIGKNRAMVAVFAATFTFQIVLVQLFGGFFSAVPLPLTVWLKIIGAALSVVVFSEIYKLFYRIFKNGQKSSFRLYEKLN